MKRTLRQIRIDQRIALKQVEKLGIKICCDPCERELAMCLFLPLLQIFGEEMSDLSLIYLYWQDEQPEELQGIDGWCNTFIHPATGRQICAIGLSLDALHCSLDYAVMVSIHELAHLKYAGDDCRFFPYMDKLLERYNRATDSDIQNDYVEGGECHGDKKKLL